MGRRSRRTGPAPLRSGLEQSLRKPGCPFCYPSDDLIVEGDASFMALYNRAPIVQGHLLVVPKDHASSIFELSESACRDLISFSRRITREMLRAYGKSDFDWLLQQGVAAGQTVEHLHIHIVPRKAGDLDSPESWFESITGTKVAVDSSDREPLSRLEIRNEVAFLREHLGHRE
jgi:diadenosine tetraphosphate (Ap4A) HIT family hydrolase